MPIYFKITDDKGRILIPGSVTIKRFAKWHPAESAQTSTGRSQGRGDAAKEMSLSRLVDNASPTFMRYATTGDIFNSVLHMVAGDGSSTYMTVNMDEVVISSHSTSGNSGGMAAVETLIFNYSKISIAYTPTAPSHTSTTETVIQSFLDDIY